MAFRPILTACLSVIGLVSALCSANAQTTVTTDPVGFHTVTINPGFQTLGLPLLRPAVAADGVQANTATVITASGTANLGATIKSGTSNTTKSFYLEITSGPANTYVGHRWDVNVPVTIASATNAITNTITISGTSANNTISGNLPNLAGYNFVVRPHATIGYIFGTKGNTRMQGATSLANADQIQFFNTLTGSFETYYLLQNGSLSFQQWCKSGEGVTSFDDFPIPPGVGMFVKRAGSASVTLTIVGDVRTTNSSPQPLKKGYNLVSEKFPVDRSLVGRGLTTSNGFTGTTNAATADQVQIFNGTNYITYWLVKGGSIEQWWQVGSNGIDVSNSPKILFDKSVFIKVSKDMVSYADVKPF